MSECVRPLQDLLSKTAVLKLNGGLGTSMGLEKAKSLLEVRDGKTFLDLIAEQIEHTRHKIGAQVLHPGPLCRLTRTCARVGGFEMQRRVNTRSYHARVG